MIRREKNRPIAINVTQLELNMLWDNLDIPMEITSRPVNWSFIQMVPQSTGP